MSGIAPEFKRPGGLNNFGLSLPKRAEEMVKQAESRAREQPTGYDKAQEW